MSQQTVLNGRYELHRRLARGGMADVFLARDQLLDRPVAVKVLFAEFATDPTFVARFRREAQAAANLTHPNIVSVFDWGEEQGTYYIVMEYVDGRSLAEILRSEGILHPTRACDIAADIAAALSFAHRNGVVHRDIKPGNVLISPSGQVKVADFGIARAVGAGVEDNLTQTGSVMGTATYFSPEQAQGLPLDPRSDLYSLGVVLYEMVAGQPPFTGDSPVAIAYKHVQEQPQPPRQLNADVSPACEAIIMRLLAKKPSDRYASAEDLRADLRRFTEGLPVLATPAPRDVAPPATQAIATTARTEGTRMVPVEQLVYDYPAPRRSNGFIVVLFLLLLLLAGLIFALAKTVGGGSGGVTQVSVPSVVNEPVDTATTALETAGFKVNRIDENSDTVQEGLVISQDPAGNTQADKGSTVTIHVSQGAVTVKMPNVVTLQEAAARQVLIAKGFQEANITTQQRPDDEAPVGEVVDQTPEPNSDVALDAKITLFVSSGPATTPVPDVAGLSVADASNRLGQAGFTVAQTNEASDTIDAGKVIRTEPPAGTPEPKDTQITIVVSTGPATTTTSETTTTTSSTTTTTAGAPIGAPPGLGQDAATKPD